MEMDYAYWAFFWRWLHVLSGVMWIGLLWYFNFVQVPSMGKIPDEQKPAITGVIAPAALIWFRWAAVATVVTGFILASFQGYIADALTLGLSSRIEKHAAIGFGMWLGILMAVNVWTIIWPSQQIALGLDDRMRENITDADRAKAARRAMLASRMNTALSIPLLYAMVSAQNLY